MGWVHTVMERGARELETPLLGGRLEIGEGLRRGRRARGGGVYALAGRPGLLLD